MIYDLNMIHVDEIMLIYKYFLKIYGFAAHVKLIRKQ